MTGRKPELCPHGILGKIKCEECKKKSSHERYEIKKIRTGRFKGVRNRKCSHGFKFMKDCHECKLEWKREYRRKKGIRPRKKCLHGEKFVSECKICRSERLRKWSIKVGRYKGVKNRICQHGILGITKCKLCQKEKQKQYNIRTSRFKGTGQLGPKPTLCPHGILGKWKCKICKSEHNHQYNIKRGLITGLGRIKLCPHGILGKSKCNKCKNEWSKTYRLKHINEIKLKYKNNIENIREYDRKDYQKNKDKIRTKIKQDRINHPEKYKTIDSRHAHKRRGLGWDIINDYFEGAIGHHINNSDVVYIPKWLHLSLLPHCVKINQNMQLVNDIIFQYLECTNQVEWIN